jgi:hypothetical protein
VIPSSTQFLLLTGLNQHAVTVSTGEFFNRIGQQATFWPDQGPRKKLRHISVCAVPFVDKGYSDRVSLLRSDAAAVTAGNGDEQRVGGGVTAKTALI